MPAVRDAWTDERLDDLNDRVAEMGRHVGEGFNRVHEDIRELRREMDVKFARVDVKFDSLQRMILQLAAGMFATMVVGFLGVIATQL